MGVTARVYRCGSERKPDDLKRGLAGSSKGWVVQTASEHAASNAFFVEMLAAQTLRARASGSLLAKSPEMDLLLRLAGTTQISKAIAEAGSVAGKPFLLILAGEGGRAPGAVLGKELPHGPLTEQELQRIERAALLSAEKR